jgi:diguanylate cyclase (GGDEF)-like protein
MLRRDSFTQLRDTLRWRVALVLASLIAVLMVVLGIINTHLGLPDTARLAWIVLGVALASLAVLIWQPRHRGGTIFFTAIALLLAVVMAYGWYVGRPMQHWAYILPPVLVFLLRSGPALVAMLVFGIYTSLTLVPLIPGIDVVRFAAGYGLLVCFMYTYALLQERAADMLRYHSDHDALSNCLNRRTFNETMEQLEREAPAGRQYAFLLIDIDHFKAINDQHGHLVGDRIITQVAAELGRQLDAGTALFRYGGEEFAVLLMDADRAAGIALGERLRAALAAADFRGVAVTASIGIATWRAGEGSIAHALDRADRALYAAKRAGRNRVLDEAAIAAAA